jgi:hypothetical protein
VAAVALGAALVLSGVSGCSDDDEAEPASTTTTLHFEGDPDSAFCNLLREAQIDEVAQIPAATPADLEANYAQTIRLFADAARQAPPEVQTDIELVRQGLIALDDALRAVGYSFDALEQSPDAAEIAAALNDPAFTEAGARIEAYKGQVCGI